MNPKHPGSQHIKGRSERKMLRKIYFLIIADSAEFASLLAPRVEVDKLDKLEVDKLDKLDGARVS